MPGPTPSSGTACAITPLLSAVPFTPVTGPACWPPARTSALARALIAFAEEIGVSSLHLLFPSDTDMRALREAGFLVRESVQFHWRNAGYADFDAFLASMSHDKRKKIRQDRKSPPPACATAGCAATPSARTSWISSTSATAPPTSSTATRLT